MALENDRMKKNDAEQKEHIMLCLSAAPSNAKIVATAEKMAKAFGGKLTALYVKTKASEYMSDEDKARLALHMKLAEQAGATITTVYNEDVPFQIAECARVSGVTKLVIGHSTSGYKHIIRERTLIDKLIEVAPNLDIHIIPDLLTEKQHVKKKFTYGVIPAIVDLIITAIILLITTAFAYFCWYNKISNDSIIAVYILGVFVTSIMTKSYGCSIINSFASVLVFNFLYVEPRLSFKAREITYIVTIGIMLIVSLLTATLANKLKRHAKESAQVAYQTRILLDTNQLLQKANDDVGMIQVATEQIQKLLKRNIVYYVEEEGRLSKEHIVVANADKNTVFSSIIEEKNVAEWVFNNQKQAGAGTDMFKESKCVYHAIHINHKVFGVVGVQVCDRALDNFENNILLSILTECALSIESDRNAKDKEAATILAKNEQLRANLLRSISHDLRTPLTTISGNAEALISNSSNYDSDVKRQMLLDIYDDAVWLNNLVENLLSVTRIEDGRMNLNISTELVEEVIKEAMNHIKSNYRKHKIEIALESEWMFAKMDSRLIIQVIINLVDNATKYTPEDSVILISAREDNGMIYISVADTGMGIAKENKNRVFEMFFTGENKIADGRRSIGLGLALCKAIVTAHGGEIELTDSIPHGCIFTFSLPKEEVKINE